MFKFNILRIDCTSHADGRLQTLGHPTPNVWVKRPILVDKDQLVEIFYLKATLTKCYENVGNQENPFNFNLVG
jgi:hypothetical protein